MKIKPIKAIMSLIKFLITIVFFIPSTFVYIAYSFIIPPIITFIIMFYFAKKENNSKAIIYNIIIHLLLLFTFISIKSNPGTDDSLASLDKVINSAMSASFFTMNAFVFFIIYLASVFKTSNEKNAITNLPKETIVQPQQTISPLQKNIVQINKKQKRKKPLFIALGLIFVGGIISFSFINRDKIIKINNEKINISNYKDEVYCSNWTMCFKYNGRRMEYYEDVDVDETEETRLDILYGKYIIINNRLYDKRDECKYSEIIKWDKNTFNIKCGNTVLHYHSKNYNHYNQKQEEYKNDLTGKPFKSDLYEILFLTNNVMLFATKTYQCALTYKLDYNGDEYWTFRAIHYSDNNCNELTKGIPTTYNNKTKELLGFKKTSLDKINYIDKSYFNDNNNKYLVEGYFQGHRNYYHLENNNLTIENDKKTYKLEIIYVYNDLIYYKNTDNSTYPTIYYNKKEDKLCESLQGCYDRIKK